eukprot:5370902-Prymnesium_polylepis.2
MAAIKVDQGGTSASVTRGNDTAKVRKGTATQGGRVRWLRGPLSEGSLVADASPALHGPKDPELVFR